MWRLLLLQVALTLTFAQAPIILAQAPSFILAVSFALWKIISAGQLQCVLSEQAVQYNSKTDQRQNQA